MGFSGSVFADDFICWRGFIIKIPTQRREAHIAEHQEIALSKLREVQQEVHAWGEANRVVFDQSKEFLHLIHRRFSHGDNFKLLGVVFDPALLMHDAARTVAALTEPLARLVAEKRLGEIKGIGEALEKKIKEL